jgi:D-alanine-D-alanine ligase
LAETRVLLLSNRDVASPDDPPLQPQLDDGELDQAIIDDTSVQLVANLIIRSIAGSPGVRVAHRAVLRPSEVLAAIGDHRPDMVFNLCESLSNDSRMEVHAAWLMQRLELPFTGSPFMALRHCLFKVECNQILARAGVRVPMTVRATSPDHIPRVRFPVLVKPEREDGSRCISRKSVVYNYKRLREQVAEVVETCQQPAVVQQYIHGREFAVSLLGWPVPRVLPPGEILFGDLPKGHPHILTYNSKWRPETIESIATPSVPAVLRPNQLRRIAAVGRRAFEVLGLRDYGRIDVRFDARGDAYVIDVNPNCDLSPDGGFAKAAKRGGLSYPHLIWEILRGAIRRRTDTSALFASRGRFADSGPSRRDRRWARPSVNAYPSLPSNRETAS